MSIPRIGRIARGATSQPGSSRGRADAAIGFRVRTGHATAVLLAGPTASPHVLARHQVLLCDMDDSDARQPYHVVEEQDEKRGMELVRVTSETATALAARATRQLLEQANSAGHLVRAAVVVVGSNVDPALLGHSHIRAHALEGRLYREAVEAGVSRWGLACGVLVERGVLATVVAVLGRPSADIRAGIDAMGSVVGRPWRAQEKAAAMAAWVGLAGGVPLRTTTSRIQANARGRN